YSEFPWKPWLFAQVPSGYWDEEANRKSYIVWLSKELGISKPHQWYSVTNQAVLEKRGSAFLAKFGGSLPKALSEAYPHFSWHPWLFDHVGNGFWDSEQNRQTYFQWLTGELGITDCDQWYTVKVQQVRDKGGTTFLKKYGWSLRRALAEMLPQH